MTSRDLPSEPFSRGDLESSAKLPLCTWGDSSSVPGMILRRTRYIPPPLPPSRLLSPVLATR